MELEDDASDDASDQEMVQEPQRKVKDKSPPKKKPSTKKKGGKASNAQQPRGAPIHPFLQSIFDHKMNLPFKKDTGTPQPTKQ